MTDITKKVGSAALQDLFDRRGLGDTLQEIEGQDPEVWAEMCEAVGRAAISALMEPTEEMYDAAWREIQTNPEHNALKQRVSVHGIRTLINALCPAMLKAALDDS